MEPNNNNNDNNIQTEINKVQRPYTNQGNKNFRGRGGYNKKVI